MDNLVFEESLNSDVEHSEFINKRWIYVNDNNNSNYSSQVVLDSTSLSNSGGYIGWSEGFIVMPLVVALTTDSLATNANLPANTNFADYSWAFKSGFWNMIDSMTIEFNNQNVCQTVPFTNVFRSFKANTTFSCDDIKNHGASTGFYPDTAGSWAYSTANTATAGFNNAGRGGNCGISNNANGVLNKAQWVVDTTNNGLANVYVSNDVAGTYGAGLAPTGSQNPTTAGGSYCVNEGMKKRQEWVGYGVNNTTSLYGLNQTAVNDSTSCAPMFRPIKSNSVAGCVSWVVYAKLRLKDLADFFEKVPLLKGSTIRFLINTNQAITNFTVTKGVIDASSGAITTQPLLTINSVSVTGGRTNPLMIASAGYGSGSSALANVCTNAGAGSATTSVYNLSVSIFKNNFPEQSAYSANILGASIPCRLYAPVYTMNPLAESKYLSLAPTKRVLYKDIFQYQYPLQAGARSFNFLVSNGINRIRSVTVIPFISNNNGGNTNINPYTTPCSATPAMPDPVMINNFNILISGVNLFISNTLYDFESFREHLMSANQLNGNLTTGLTSGMISEDDFARGYRYYYGDCSRALPSEENVSRSVQIIGEIKSLVNVELMVFVEFMKEITIDLTTGARVD